MVRSLLMVPTDGIERDGTRFGSSLQRSLLILLLAFVQNYIIMNM